MIRTGKTWRKTIVIARQPDIGSYKVIPSGLHFSHWRCAVNIQRSSPSLLGSSCHFTLSNGTTAETYAPVHRLHRSQTNNNPLPMGNTIGRIMRYLWEPSRRMYWGATTTPRSRFFHWQERSPSLKVTFGTCDVSRYTVWLNDWLTDE